MINEEDPERSTQNTLILNPANLLNWGATSKVCLVTFIVTPLTLWYLSVFHYLQRHPGTATYINRETLSIIIKFQTGLCAAWLLLLAITWLTRRKLPHCKLYVHSLFCLYVWTVIYFSYAIGAFNSMFLPAGALAGVGVGLILFDRTLTMAWFSLGLTVVLGAMLLEQFGFIPYAPLLVSAPFSNGHLELSYIITVEAVAIALLPVTVTFFWFLTKFWHNREDQLAETRNELAAANQLISRYVPEQLAKGILNKELIDQLQNQRRKITVVFTDVVNFTDLSDHLEPEETARLLNEYLSEMTAIIHSHGGTLDKFVGDGIMIYFGAPSFIDNKTHANQAIEMSLSMLARTRELSRIWLGEILEEPFKIRVGINTGYANVGNFGPSERMTYTAIGRAVNLASRIESHCPANSILISHSTWLLVKENYKIDFFDEINMKGVSRSVRTYVLKDVAED